jgi:hypothetical protein
MKHLRWDFIFILNEFQEQLRILDLVEVSLLNKFIRIKLKKIIFSRVELGKSIFKILPFFRIDWSDNLIFKDVSYRRLSSPYLMSTIIQPSINELIDEVRELSHYLYTLKFSNIYGAAYFLMPLALNFNHLTSLKFYESTVDQGDFKHLMDNLTSLEILVLYKSKLLKQLGYEPIESEIVVPSSLKYLAITYLYIDSIGLQNNPYKYIFHNCMIDSREVVLFPPKYYQRLKKLQLEYAADKAEYILEFLSLNPQLTCIILPLKILYLNGIKVLAENNNVNKLIVDPCYIEEDAHLNAKVPILSSLYSLHITKVLSRSHSKILEIITAFSAIRKLEIDLIDYDSQFIANLVDKLTQLKSLTVRAEFLHLNNIDLFIYSNIEALKLNINAEENIFYKLPSPPMKIKSIFIASGTEYKQNFKFLKDHYNCSHWEIRLVGEVASCKALMN